MAAKQVSPIPVVEDTNFAMALQPNNPLSEGEGSDVAEWGVLVATPSAGVLPELHGSMSSALRPEQRVDTDPEGSQPGTVDSFGTKRQFGFAVVSPSVPRSGDWEGFDPFHPVTDRIEGPEAMAEHNLTVMQEQLALEISMGGTHRGACPRVIISNSAGLMSSRYEPPTGDRDMESVSHPERRMLDTRGRRTCHTYVTQMTRCTVLVMSVYVLGKQVRRFELYPAAVASLLVDGLRGRPKHFVPND
jgi:hypothetical protein